MNIHSVLSYGFPGEMIRMETFCFTVQIKKAIGTKAGEPGFLENCFCEVLCHFMVQKVEAQEKGYYFLG